MSMLLNHRQKRIVTTVTFGNILEWFEIYSYAYFAPIIGRIFFNFESELSGLIGAFLTFGLGFMARPFGALVFGRVGDLIGRKQAFIWSIIIMTTCNFLMGFLPTFSRIGIFSCIFLVILKILQSISAAGETPGTICFLYENADVNNKRFLTSFTGVGNQIGAILGLIESFLIDRYVSNEFLLSWGWRILFWSGGILGLLGFFLRRMLYETPLFEKFKSVQAEKNEYFFRVIKKYKKKVGLGIGYGIIDAAAFYLIATYIPTFLDKILGLSSLESVLVSLLVLILTTVLLPFFGILGDRINNKFMMISCAVMMILLLPLLWQAINNDDLALLAVVGFLYIFPITCISAILAYLLARIFPTEIRFTGIGLAFNLADGLAGGFAPLAALYLFKFTGNQAAFCWFMLVSASISLFSYFRIERD